MNVDYRSTTWDQILPDIGVLSSTDGKGSSCQRAGGGEATGREVTRSSKMAPAERLSQRITRSAHDETKSNANGMATQRLMQ